MQVQKYELRESTSKKRKEYYGIPIISDTENLNDLEKDQQIQELKKQLLSYQEQLISYQEEISNLQEKVYYLF